MQTVRTPILLAAMFAGACSAPSAPGVKPPLPEVRYLPQPATPCLRKEPPKEPAPPPCLVQSPQTCSGDQEDEYTAALLDHRERLQVWAYYAWAVCHE